MKKSSLLSALFGASLAASSVAFAVPLGQVTITDLPPSAPQAAPVFPTEVSPAEAQSVKVYETSDLTSQSMIAYDGQIVGLKCSARTVAGQDTKMPDGSIMGCVGNAYAIERKAGRKVDPKKSGYVFVVIPAEAAQSYFAMKLMNDPHAQTVTLYGRVEKIGAYYRLVTGGNSLTTDFKGGHLGWKTASAF